MQVVSSLEGLRVAPGRGIAVAFGVFDGVHRGHRKLLDALLALAAKTDSMPVAMTFEPHPRAVVRPDEPTPPRLCSPEGRLRLFSGAGVEGAVVMPFTRELAALPPASFMETCLHMSDRRLRGVCIGAGWRFGAGGAGDTALLRRLGREHGFEVDAVPELRLYRLPVSSTRIRAALQAGRLAFAERLLGRPYSLEGVIAHGRGEGTRVLACPTANIAGAGQLLPSHGVYAARARLLSDDGLAAAAAAPLPGVAYIGTAPTLAGPGAPPVLEFHAFGHSGDLYGRRMEVELLEFLRLDMVFPTPELLREQIRRDIGQARRRLGLPPDSDPSRMA